MGVMEAKVEKDLRNGINRRVNCETANLTKVVDASIEQVAAIRKLQKQGRLKELPPKLRETAKLRLDNPEATLQELAAMQDPPVSKSAMNHRMRKLVALADESWRRKLPWPLCICTSTVNTACLTEPAASAP